MDSFILLGDLCLSLTGGRMGGAGGKYEHPFSKGLCELICLSNRGDERHFPLSKHSPAGTQWASQVIRLPQLLRAIEDGWLGAAGWGGKQGKAGTDSQQLGIRELRQHPEKGSEQGKLPQQTPCDNGGRKTCLWMFIRALAWRGNGCCFPEGQGLIWSARMDGGRKKYPTALMWTTLLQARKVYSNAAYRGLTVCALGSLIIHRINSVFTDCTNSMPLCSSDQSYFMT